MDPIELVGELCLPALQQQPGLSGPAAAQQVVNAADTGSPPYPPGEGPRIPQWWP
jgi:hypothetical protein